MGNIWNWTLKISKALMKFRSNSIGNTELEKWHKKIGLSSFQFSRYYTKFIGSLVSKGLCLVYIASLGENRMENSGKIVDFCEKIMVKNWLLSMTRRDSCQNSLSNVKSKEIYYKMEPFGQVKYCFLYISENHTNWLKFSPKIRLLLLQRKLFIKASVFYALSLCIHQSHSRWAAIAVRCDKSFIDNHLLALCLIVAMHRLGATEYSTVASSNFHIVFPSNVKSFLIFDIGCYDKSTAYGHSKHWNDFIFSSQCQLLVANSIQL